MMNKQRNNTLMQIANEVLMNNKDKYLFKDCNALSIQDSYNGQIAAFGVSVAMSGILPTLAIYYKEKSSTDVDRRQILEVLSRMVQKDKPKEYPNISDAKSMFSYAINNEANLDAFTKEIEECSIALKQVVRTFKLVK